MSRLIVQYIRPGKSFTLCVFVSDMCTELHARFAVEAYVCFLLCQGLWQKRLPVISIALLDRQHPLCRLSHTLAFAKAQVVAAPTASCVWRQRIWCCQHVGCQWHLCYLHCKQAVHYKSLAWRPSASHKSNNLNFLARVPDAHGTFRQRDPWGREHPSCHAGLPSHDPSHTDKARTRLSRLLSCSGSIHWDSFSVHSDCLFWIMFFGLAIVCGYSMEKKKLTFPYIFLLQESFVEWKHMQNISIWGIVICELRDVCQGSYCNILVLHTNFWPLLWICIFMQHDTP